MERGGIEEISEGRCRSEGVKGEAAVWDDQEKEPAVFDHRGDVGQPSHQIGHVLDGVTGKAHRYGALGATASASVRSRSAARSWESTSPMDCGTTSA